MCDITIKKPTYIYIMYIHTRILYTTYIYTALYNNTFSSTINRTGWDRHHISHAYIIINNLSTPNALQ
jgi:hypothetical protein